SSAVSTRVPTQAAKCELLSVLPPRHLLSHIPSLCSQHAPSTFLLPHTTASTFLLPHTTASTFTSRSTLLSHIPVFSHTLVRFFLCLHCMHLLHGVHHACWQLSIPPHLHLFRDGGRCKGGSDSGRSKPLSCSSCAYMAPFHTFYRPYPYPPRNRPANSIYSGTVAGAREAVIQGAPGISISLDWTAASTDALFSPAAATCLPLIRCVLEAATTGQLSSSGGDPLLLNVNVPLDPVKPKVCAAPEAR
ncbi:unnamed protein product, partial [Closterium sp. NIES-53]